MSQNMLLGMSRYSPLPVCVPPDVTIPTGSGDGEPIQLRAGQTVLVIRTAKGVYLRLQDGRIIAIRMPPGSGEGREL